MIDLTQFGVGADALTPMITSYPKKVQGRVAHIDADFTSYQIAADTRDEMDGIRPMRSLEYKLGQVEDIFNELMERAGATSYVAHVTPGGSTKGGRREQAIQLEYQANRAGREKPEHLDKLRAYIGETTFRRGYGAVHLDQEADDGLAQAALASKDNIILSADKDLRMVQGLHMDMKTDEIVYVDEGYGKIELVTRGTEANPVKKIEGYGPAYFFAQLLMGDQADNIKGLPAVAGVHWLECSPTAAYIKSLGMHNVDPENKKYLDQLAAHRSKTKSCGAVMTYKLLKDIDNVKDAWHLCKSLFNDLNTQHGYGYAHWKTGVGVHPNTALLGDMQLLWMRRNNNPNDVVEWLKSQIA